MLFIFQVFDFTLDAEEIKSITALNRGWRYIVPMIEVSVLYVCVAQFHR